MNSILPQAADPVGMLVFFLLVFVVIGIFFLFVHMLMGKFIRPSIPDSEKLTIYECGEPTVGSAWIQFDLRFYVVALLFVIFDVEVAFFFPWATVFGKLNQLANMDPVMNVNAFEDPSKKKALTEPEMKALEAKEAERLRVSTQLMPSGAIEGRGMLRVDPVTMKPVVAPIDPETAGAWARIAFWDLLVFFGVLMVGFAYVWRRGDIDWVRAYAPHQEPATPPEKPLEQGKAVA
jgi:NADH-quinone oxidoreductase subunit A